MGGQSNVTLNTFGGRPRRPEKAARISVDQVSPVESRWETAQERQVLRLPLTHSPREL